MYHSVVVGLSEPLQDESMAIWNVPASEVVDSDVMNEEKSRHSERRAGVNKRCSLEAGDIRKGNKAAYQAARK